MIRLTIVYPAAEGARFDFEYYIQKHLPLGEKLLRDHGLLSWQVQRCLGSITGGAPDYLCITHLDFDSLEGMRAGMRAHGPELRADFAAYTDIVPVATVCECAAAAAVSSDLS